MKTAWQKALRLALTLGIAWPVAAAAASYYVRQTVGDDSRSGTSPQTAWKSLGKLPAAMHAGDVVYVGPGLYREQITVTNPGEPGRRLLFVADPTGQHTGDPPGVVMITGADPIDESIFVAEPATGVYRATLPYAVHGVVEMDGPQYRYRRARDAREHLVEKLPEREVVNRLPSSYFFDREASTLYVHTSDGEPPTAHEIEIIRRGTGIGVWGKPYVTVMGFAFRHMGDAAISFFRGSDHGAALDNVSYGGRQGIRVYGSKDVLVYGNTLFRNDNSGVYFALESTDGRAIGNVAYENVKGVRWSSKSANAVVLDNALFENHEAGIVFEDADDALVRRNTVVGNGRSQLLVIRSRYSSETNCLEIRSPEQLVADFVFLERYPTLAGYREGKRQDLHSRDGGCPLPGKVDVRR
ncbi:MAG: NosD domain-containing protein, partial [Candidatus Binatia bacterium]